MVLFSTLNGLFSSGTMGNSPSHRAILVFLLVILNNGECLKTPLFTNTGSRRFFYSKPTHTPRKSLEYRYCSSNENNAEAISASNTPASGVSPLYLSTTADNKSKQRTASSKERKGTKAPTIDSDLLRFLSLQKKAPLMPVPPSNNSNENDKQINEENNYNDIPPSNSIQPNVDSSINGEVKQNSITKKKSSVTERKQNDEQTMEKYRISSQAVIENSWIEQFKAEKVTQTLLAHGSLREEARTAGIAVQNHAYLRMRKRSINRFLKDRDELWATYKLINATNPFSVETDRSFGDSQGENKEENSDKKTAIKDNVEKIVSLMIEKGLTATDCAAILTHTPGIAMMRARRIKKKANGNKESQDTRKKSDGVTLEETLDRAYSGILFETLKLKKSDARKILRTCPGLLTKRGSLGGEKMIELLTMLGASSKSLARDKRYLPVLLSRAPAAFFQLVSFLACDAIRMPIKKIGPFLRNPASFDLLDAVCPAPTSSDTSELQNSSWDILPQPPKGIMVREVIEQTYKKMRENADALRLELGVTDLKKLILAYPGVLLLDPSTQIFPMTDFLYSELGISDIGVPQIIESYPGLLKADIKKMRETVGYLLELEVEEDSIAKIFRAFPAILTLDKETQMIPVVNFLRDIGVVNIGRFITRLPAVLGYSVENDLKPKWGYLTQVCGFDYFEVVRFPAYFSYPLDRITSRYEYLGSKRIPLRLVSVDTVLRYGDNDFATLVAGDKDKGKCFKEFVKERLSKTRKTRTKHKSNDRKNKIRKTGVVYKLTKSTNEKNISDNLYDVGI